MYSQQTELSRVISTPVKYHGLSIFFQYVWLKFYNPSDINANKVDFLQLC